MIVLSLFAGEALLALAWLLYRGITWAVQKRIDWKREAMLLLMLCNLGVIFRFVFYPFFMVSGRVQPLVIDIGEIFPPRINPVPFLHIAEYDNKREALINIIGNVLLFLPTGILLPVLYRRLDRFGKVLAAGACISLCIELIQLLLPGSVTDIDDLILNTAGVALGCAIFSLFRRLIKKA